MSRAESLFEELVRLYELNIKLAENMHATLMWIVKYSDETGTEIPNLDTLTRLVREADRLAQTIKEPMVPQHSYIKPLDPMNGAPLAKLTENPLGEGVAS
jgi:hypothetical protein